LRRFDTIQQCDRQTDGRKDASAVAKTRLALHAVARKK